MNKDSNDILTKYNLLTDQSELVTYGGLTYIDVCVVSKEKQSKLFAELDDLFSIPKRTCHVLLSINNADWYSFFNDDDKVDMTCKDAPQLRIVQLNKKGYENLFTTKDIPLSKNDAIYLSKYLISYYMDIVDDLKCVETELNN